MQANDNKERAYEKSFKNAERKAKYRQSSCQKNKEEAEIANKTFGIFSVIAFGRN